MYLVRLLDWFRKYRIKAEKRRRLKSYRNGGSIPWSEGYLEFRNSEIEKCITNKELLSELLISQEFPTPFGMKLDERIVEYCLIFSHIMSLNPNKILDAGSTFNFDFIVSNETLNNSELTIATYYPESVSFNHKRISYNYSDLRELPYRDGYFDMVVCQSTLEHIDMDNSIYGYDLKRNSEHEVKSYEFLKVVSELIRILKRRGVLLITVPFGKFENHGFFQQFDSEMIDSTIKLLESFSCEVKSSVYQYMDDSWKLSSREKASECVSFNPHSGRGKLNDNAAHSRSIFILTVLKP